jgi:RNA polymerase sigma-70 factor (ECF subfamily)
MTEAHVGHEERARCQALFERLSEYLDGELNASLCAEIGSHLDGCAPCKAFLESLRRTVLLLGRTPCARLPEDLCAEVLRAAAGCIRGRRNASPLWDQREESG